MLQQRGRNVAMSHGNTNSWQSSAVVNSGSYMSSGIHRPTKRPLNGSATELEPAIKQEKLDSGYEEAMLNQTGTLLGTVVPSSTPNIPHPVTVLNSFRHKKGGRPQKTESTTLNKTLTVSSLNGCNNRMPNRPVVLLPHGAVRKPHQGSYRALLPHSVTVPSSIQMSTHGRITAQSPAHSTTPLIVRVSLPSVTGITGTRTIPNCLTSSAVTTSSTLKHPIIRLTSVPRISNIQGASNPLARLKAMIGKSVLDKYVGPQEPPPELQMSACSKRICHSCGDEFVTEVGMVDHISRRSMLLSFRCVCNVSKWPRLFYNPCMFDSFYRAHFVQPGVHVSRESVVISSLDLDTPEYRSCLEAQKQRQNIAAGAKEVGQRSENINGEQHVTSERSVKEIYVNVEVMPNEQTVPSENVAKETAAAVVKKINKNHAAKPVLAAKSGLIKKGRRHSMSAVDSSLLKDFSKALCCNRTKCLECLKDYKTRHRLSSHFSESTGQPALRCAVCGLMLPTVCSRSAHQRLHQYRWPNVCPQCGIVFDEAESLEVFKSHVERCCFHLTSGPSVTNCPRCSFKTAESDTAKMSQHFVDAHATVYYKCRSCPKAFANDSAAERHSKDTGHDGQKDIVRKCPSCDSVFKDGSGADIYSHVLEHLSISEFSCPVCPVRASDQTVVVEHFRLCHPETILPSTTCEVCGHPCSSQEDLFTHTSSKHVDYFDAVMRCIPSKMARECEPLTQNVPNSNTSSARTPSASGAVSGRTASTTERPASESEAPSSTSSSEVYECGQCQMKFTTQDMYNRHQAKHQFLQLKKARKKHTAAKSPDDPSQQVPLPKEERCTRCCRTFDSAESLTQHINTVHGTPGWHSCHLCADGFSTGHQLDQHMAVRHGGKTESSNAYVCALCAETPDKHVVSYRVQGLLTKHLQNAHGVPRKAAGNMARAAAPSIPDPATDAEQVEDSPRCSVSCEVEPVKRLFVSGETTHYQCSRCEFSADDRAEFVRHASEHSPAIAGAVQCKECAASFTAGPALYRHLRIIHRMDCNIDTYLMDNGYTTSSSTPDTVTADEDWISPGESMNNSSMTSSGSCSSESKRSSGKSATMVKGDDDDDDAPKECTVCYRVFLSKQLLRAHMRVHGMAFIQRTRRKLAVSSPVSVPT